MVLEEDWASEAHDVREPSVWTVSERPVFWVGTCGVSAVCPGEALLRFDEADDGVLEMVSTQRMGKPSMGHKKKERTGA
jgi:hypothetical protein